METRKHRIYFYYSISVLFLAIGLSGINRLITKADLPFSYFLQGENIVSKDHCDSIKPGDIVFTIDDIRITGMYQLEIILDKHSVGEDANIEIATTGDSHFKPNIHLVRYYRNLDFILISFLVGLSFWISAVFLIIKRIEGKSVTVLFWVLMFFSVATMTSPGKYYSGDDWIAYLVRAAHVISYLLGAITFLHFTLIFPRIRTAKYKSIISVLYISAFLFCIILVTAQLNSIIDNLSGWIAAMENLWVVTEIILLICIFSGALNLYLFYRKVNDRPERKKTEWIFWGLSAGVCPFLLLWLLPRLLGYDELIKEEFLLAFMILVPVSFAMAVIKYNLFEIEILIKKSVLYTALTIITVIIYFSAIFVMALFASDLMEEYRNLVSIFLILFIAFIFNPLQNKLRNYIDKIFYRETYDFEKTISNFLEGIKNQNTISGLSKYVIAQIEKIIPVKKIALVAATESEDKLGVLSQNHFSDIREFISAFDVSQIRSDPPRIISLAEKVTPGILTEKCMPELLEKYGINIIIPFLPDPKDTAGAILLGDKLSEMRYTNRDIEILNLLISDIALAFKKLQLQRKLVLEETEILRLEEINKMMSYYVSSVSHDLKTPLTSIKMFAEILREQNNYKNGSSKEYLDIIEGESDRLSRLINNVLNYSRIENGIKEYSFARIDLKACIEDVFRLMEYQFRIENFTVEKSLQENIYITADYDAIKEVLINLFTNAIKYSPDKKIIRVSSQIESGHAVVKIEDEGIGISLEDRRKIFKPFVRSNDSQVKHTGGAGIGLSIVKNILDVHKASVEVKSKLGNGSSFILYFRLADS